MKIAFIVPYVPNQIRTRSFNLIIHLSRQGHEVDVFTVGRGNADQADAELLQNKCKNVYYYVQPIWRSLLNSTFAVPSGKPLQSVYSLQAGLLGRLGHVLERKGVYDVVHVEHLRGSEYGRFIKTHYSEMRVVWDSVDCISHLFRQAAGQSTSLFGRLIPRFELGRTERAEASLLTLFDHVLVTSRIDRNALMETLSDEVKPAPISILSNGVDQEYFKPNSTIQKELETLVFSGKMSYHANISMVKYLVKEIMPLIWQYRPNVRLYVVGKDPSVEIKRMGENPLIQVTGTVADIRPFLWRSTVAVAPLVYGAGVQNKILEAMAVGLPVVTTSKALLSLGVTPGREVLAGDTPTEFSTEVLNLLNNAALSTKIGESGLAFVRDNHNWGKITKQLVEIYSRQILSINADFA